MSSYLQVIKKKNRNCFVEDGVLQYFRLVVSMSTRLNSQLASVRNIIHSLLEISYE